MAGPNQYAGQSARATPDPALLEVERLWRQHRRLLRSIAAGAGDQSAAAAAGVPLQHVRAARKSQLLRSMK